MSRRRNNQHSNGDHENRRSTRSPGAKQDATRKDDMSIEEVSHGIDMEAADIGLAIAGLFKTLVLAAVRLPNMEMYSDLISVVVDDDSITVSVAGLSCKDNKKHGGKTRASRCHCCEDPGYEEDSYNPYKDDEEERVYDGD
jgi:hypothetical protein